MRSRPPASPLRDAFAPHLRWRSSHSVRRLLLVTLILLVLLYASRRSHVPLPALVRDSPWVAQAARYLPAHILEEDVDEGVFDDYRRLPSPAKIVKPKQAKEETLAIRTDGRVIIPKAQTNMPRQHPIPILMRKAKKQWQYIKARQSKTFKEAVAVYRRRNGRNPPKGFDKFYAFCRHHNVKIIDDYKLIDDAIRPFFALSPVNFRKRVEYTTQWGVTAQGWGLEVKDAQVRAFGAFAEGSRALDSLQLMERFVTELPDFKSYHTAHDGPHIWLSGDERARLEGLALKGQFDPQEDEDPDYLSKAFTPPIGPMPQTCPVETPMREEGFQYGVAQNDTLMPPLPKGASAAFIGNIRAALDICRNTEIRHMHSASSFTYPLPGPHLPLFSPGVHGHFADLPSIVTEQFNDEEYDDTPWSARTDPRVLWRGQTSGPSYWQSNWPWKSSHRARLHLLAQDGPGTPSTIHLDARDGSGVNELPVAAAELNTAFLDVGMVGPAVQCNEADGTCDEMARVFQGYKDRVTIEESRRYKFELDIDGNSWSGRFRRLMLSSAVVMKATLFPQFWTEWAVPWYHYVPVSVDYSDLWDILAYFRGDLSQQNAHDEAAREIAEAGQRFAEQYLRWEDMEAYQFRLFLEYARLYNLDRRADGPGPADYTGDGQIEPDW